MPKLRDIIVLGASMSGLSAAHYILRHILPHLPKDDEVKYRVVLVDPSSKFYWRPASPRAVGAPNLAPKDDLFLEYASAFVQYGDDITIIQATATSWDYTERKLRIKRSIGNLEDLPYYGLILATGTRSSSPVFSLQGENHDSTASALHGIREQLLSAKSVLVAGGGPTGVETASEIKEYHDRQHPEKQLKVTLITGADRLLPVLRPAIATQAAKYLRRLGVDVRYGSKIVSSEKNNKGSTSVLLEDGTKLEADVYIPAIGLTPMTEYVPKELLNDEHYIKTNERTLRVDQAGPLVYALGDVSSYSRNGIVDIMMGLPVLATNLERDLLAKHSSLAAIPLGPDRVLKAVNPETQMVSIGQSYGVGAAFGWRLPEFMVWRQKGGHMKVQGGDEWVRGDRWQKPEWFMSKWTRSFEAV